MKHFLIALPLLLISCTNRQANWSPEQSPLPYVAHLLEQFHRREGRLPRDITEALQVESSALKLIPSNGVEYRWKITSWPGTMKTDPELAEVEIQASVSGKVVASYNPSIKLGIAERTWLPERHIDPTGRISVANTLENCRIELARCILEHVSSSVADEAFGTGDWRGAEEIIKKLVGRCDSLRAFIGMQGKLAVRRQPGSSTVDFRVGDQIYSFTSKRGAGRTIPKVTIRKP